jgi:hypothetical protein
VPYGIFDNDPNNDYYEGYRTDCSGFISYAWSLPTPGAMTNELIGKGYAKEISISDLQPGDSLNNEKPLKAGHIVIFVKWIDQSKHTFIAYDENIVPGYASEKQFSLAPTSDNNGWTITELDAYAKGPYKAQRLIYASGIAQILSDKGNKLISSTIVPGIVQDNNTIFPSDFLLLPDASNIQDIHCGEMIYTSNYNITAAIEYYQSEMPRQGWKLSGQDMYDVDEYFGGGRIETFLYFENSGKRRTVEIVNASSSSTSISTIIYLNDSNWYISACTDQVPYYPKDIPIFGDLRADFVFTEEAQRSGQDPMNFMHSIYYYTPETEENILEFYRSIMPSRGWVLTYDAISQGDTRYYFLQFYKSGNASPFYWDNVTKTILMEYLSIQTFKRNTMEGTFVGINLSSMQYTH